MQAAIIERKLFGGDETIHGLIDAIYAGAPYTVIQRAMVIAAAVRGGI